MTRLLYTIALLLLVSRSAISAPSCPTIIKDLSPCLSYLQGKGATPKCCEGVKSLSGMAKSKEDRVAICNCAKLALSTYKYDPKIIPLLPKACGANIELPPVDKNYDCSKANMMEIEI